MNEIGILTHSFVDAYNGRTDNIFGGGLERYLFDLSVVIRELGMEPVIHQLSYCGSFRTELEGIRVIGYDCSDNDIVGTFNRMSASASGLLIYASFIWQEVDYKAGSIGICHGINWDNHMLQPGHKAEAARNVQRALDRLDRIISVDSHFLTFCRAVCSFQDPEKVVLLPNSVDTGHFIPREQEAGEDTPLRILYPRRISIERGIVPMMLVADRILEQYDQAVIEFAGELIEQSLISRAFELWLKEHPHRSRIEHRAYSFQQMIEAYRNADIAVIPTIFSEGTSYSCLETMSCGIPVVSGNVGGLNDLIIDGFNGLLVAPTEDRLFEAIQRLIESRKLRRYLGANARLSAMAFDRQIWMRKWKEILADYVR